MSHIMSYIMRSYVICHLLYVICQMVIVIWHMSYAIRPVWHVTSHMSYVICHTSYVLRHMSHAIWQMSYLYVTCHMSFVMWSYVIRHDYVTLIFLYKPWGPRCFFYLKSSWIWIPMLWIYDHYKVLHSFSAGIDVFRHQILTSLVSLRAERVNRLNLVGLVSSKHETLTQFCFNVGLPSPTSAQH